MSELRTEFERLHPVPECVEWFGNCYCAKSNNMDEELEADRYDEKWQGFQAGHAAGLEDAAKFLDEWNTAIGDDLAKSIRAMKEPK